jgi:hypothetical protein
LPADLARLLRMDPNALVRFAGLVRTSSTLKGVDWRWFTSFAGKSFVGWFGWLTLPLPPALLSAVSGLGVLLGAGILVGLLKHARTPPRARQAWIHPAALWIGVGIAATVGSMVALYLNNPDWYPPQGRYLFPFLPALAILTVWGWHALWPRKLQPVALGALLLAALLFDLACWGYVIIPAFYS